MSQWMNQAQTLNKEENWKILTALPVDLRRTLNLKLGKRIPSFHVITDR